jgi:hypothetical protein
MFVSIRGRRVDVHLAPIRSGSFCPTSQRSASATVALRFAGISRVLAGSRLRGLSETKCELRSGVFTESAAHAPAALLQKPKD